jgi:mycofactocin precursor
MRKELAIAVKEEQPIEMTQVVKEIIVEELSIDGICDVY